jgi:hypothetical protein
MTKQTIDIFTGEIYKMKGNYDRNRKIDWSDLNQLYTENKLSSLAIARMKCCSKSTVLKEMKNQSIISRKGKDAFSEEYIRYLSKSRTGENNPFYGKTHSDKLKKKWSEFRVGENHHCFGKHLSEEIKAKIKKTCIERGVSVGENNPNFKDWISKEPYTKDWNDVLKEKIRARDDYICKICNTPQEELKERLHIHHVDYNKKNMLPNNLISLCRKCHIITNYNRSQWKLYFQSLLKELYNYEYSSNGEIIINLQGDIK